MNTTLRFPLLFAASVKQFRIALLISFTCILSASFSKAQTVAPASCDNTVYTWGSTTSPTSVSATTGTFTVPAGGPYLIKITAAGAQGGSGQAAGGSGVVMTGTFIVNAGQQLDITAGASGGNGSYSGGGGGGSGVYIDGTTTPLIIAGGGGGGATGLGGNALTSNSGSNTGAAGSGGTSNSTVYNAGNGGGLNSAGVSSGAGSGGGGFSGTGGSASNIGGTGAASGGGGAGGGGGGVYGSQAIVEFYTVSAGGGGGGYSGGNGGLCACVGGSGDGGYGGGSINNSTNASIGTPNAGGGYVTITCLGALPSTTTSVSSSNNPSFTSAPNNGVTFTATVTSNSQVTSGTVTFSSNGTTIPGGASIPVSNGQATLSTAFSAEGTYNIVATYNQSALYASSFGSITQTVNNHTQVSGNQFCNTGSITLGSSNSTSPYPSNIFVSGLSANINAISINLNNITASNPSEIGLLLVAPGGQKFVIMSGAGGNTSVSGINLTLSDAGGSSVPSSTLISGTFKPSAYTSVAGFPAPAPAGPYTYSATTGAATFASVLNGSNPNGTWSLFAIDGGGGTATIAGGWCLNITVPTPTHITANAGTTPQSTVVNTAFGNALAATVTDAGGSPMNGVSVIFTAPSSGATGTFSNGTNTITVTTDANGVVLAGIFTANATVGGPYQVTATVASTSLTTNFNLTNNAAVATCPSTYTLNGVGYGPATGTWTAPPAGGPFLIQITAAGGQGGDAVNNPGNGAVMTGTFIVNAGQQLDIEAGGFGGASSYAGGGGGGSGVKVDASGAILIIAGGGGGGGQTNGGNGLITTSGPNTGTPGIGGSTVANAGGGGGLNSASVGGGGSGFNAAGGGGGGLFGSGSGGFGGGGGGYSSGAGLIASGGGGGGYSGGNGGNNTGGYGAGSINNGTNPVNTAGGNAGVGYVTIQCMGSAGPTSSVLSVNGTAAICNGSSANLSVTITGGTSPYTVIYKDNSNSQFTVNNYVSGTDIPVSPTATTMYSLFSVTDASSIAGTGNSGTPTITVNPRPTGSISGGGTYCSGSNTTTNLTLTVTGSGTVNGTLSDGTPFSGTAPTINVSVAPTLTTTYTIVTLSDVNNCTAQPSDLTGSATITVNPRPTGSISGGGIYCSGSNTTTNLTLTVTGSGTVNGTLSDGTPFSGTAPTINVSVAPASTTTYTILTLSDVNNCPAQPSDLTGSATITVNPRPTGSISGGGTYCSGSNTTTNLTLTVTGSGTVNGTLSDGTPFSGTAPTINVSVSPISTTTYTIVTLNDANNCPAQPSDLSGSATVTVNPQSTGSVSGTTAVCQNASSPNVTFTGSGGSGSYTFTYTFSDGTTTTTGLTAQGSPSTSISVSTGMAGTFTYTLTGVTDASGTQCPGIITQSSAVITVNPLPAATISGTTKVCQNASPAEVTFTGSGGTAPYTFTYNVSDGTNTTSGLMVTGNPATVAAPSGTAGTFTYTLTSVKDGSATSCPQTMNGQSATITVTTLPVATIMTASEVTAASTGNAASVTNAGNGATYSWTMGNGTITSGSGTNSITYTAGNSGSVSLSVVVAASGGCAPVSSGTVLVPITAQSCPKASITVANAVCTGSTGNIASVANAGMGSHYVWAILNGTITAGSGTNSITYKAGLPGFVLISVKVTNSSGGCTVSSGIYAVCVAPLPVAVISAASSVCTASAGNTAYVPNCGTATYSWSITNGTITAGSRTSKITYKAGSSGSVTLSVVVTNSAGCKSSSGNKVVTISAYPVASITAGSSVCAGSPGNTASVATAGSGAKYNWNITNGCITSGSSNSSITYTAGGSGTVSISVTITNSGGCSIASAKKTITITAMPNASITAVSSVCPSSTGNTASVAGAGSGATYSWTVTNGTITSGSGTSGIKYTAGNSGSLALTVKVTNATGCMASGSKSVMITPNMVPAFAQIGPLCTGTKAPSLPSKSINGITGTWSPNKISTSSPTTSTYTFTPAAGQCASSTTMKITVKNCTALSGNDMVSSQQVISKPALKMDAVILPNPTQNFFTLVVKGNRKEVAEIRVFDVRGRWLNHFRTATDTPVRFGGNYAQGTYIIEVLQGPDRKILKAIKE